MPSQLHNLRRTLAWGDFTPRQAKPPGPGQTLAGAETVTSYGLSLRTEVVPGTKPVRFRIKDDVSVTVTFQKQQSWVASWVLQLSAAEQARLLGHEQGHYDLVALLARDLFIDLMQLKANSHGTSNAALADTTKVRQGYDAKLGPLQRRYDTDTNHGQNQIAQARWNGFVQSAFTQARNPPVSAPDGTPYKVRLLDVLQAAGVAI
jgi:hypothetical protein